MTSSTYITDRGESHWHTKDLQSLPILLPIARMWNIMSFDPRLHASHLRLCKEKGGSNRLQTTISIILLGRRRAACHPEPQQDSLSPKVATEETSTDVTEVPLAA